jgi:hypothetical protein
MAAKDLCGFYKQLAATAGGASQAFMAIVQCRKPAVFILFMYL